MKRGLNLSGGGARGAYQAGALRAIAEICDSLNVRTPFPIVTGVSAGAINASGWASGADRYLKRSEDLVNAWSHLHSSDVYRSDIVSIGRIGLFWIFDLILAGFVRRKRQKYLLDSRPLRKFLSGVLTLDRLEAIIESGHLENLAVSATDYSSSESVTFIQGKKFEPWFRVRRMAEQSIITVEHIAASAAIPILFPAVKVQGRYFGDGSLRNNAPLSPAIHLGAQKLMIVSVRHNSNICKYVPGNPSPSIGRIFGVILNGILMDATDSDMERLTRVNKTLSQIPESENKTGLKPVEYLWIQPSEDLGQLAKSKHDLLPPFVRYLLRGLGSVEEAGELISYLLFEPGYSKELISLGYKDALNMKAEIEKFFLEN